MLFASYLVAFRKKWKKEKGDWKPWGLHSLHACSRSCYVVIFELKPGFEKKYDLLGQFAYLAKTIASWRRAVTPSSLERKVWGSNLGQVKFDTVLPTTCHRCDISSKGAVLPGRNDAEMVPANSLHALAEYRDFKERFDESLSRVKCSNEYVPSWIYILF